MKKAAEYAYCMLSDHSVHVPRLSFTDLLLSLSGLDIIPRYLLPDALTIFSTVVQSHRLSFYCTCGLIITFSKMLNIRNA